MKSLILKRIIRLFKNKTYVINQSVEDKIEGVIIIGNRTLVNLGKNVSFGGNVILYANHEITIGDYTMIALNCILHTSTHQYNTHPMFKYRIDRPIKVGSHVWIGVGAIVLPGVIIDDYAVIGAGTVVTANVPKGAIVGGNPSRIIKFRDLENVEFDNLDLNSSIKKMGYLENSTKIKIGVLS